MQEILFSRVSFSKRRLACVIYIGGDCNGYVIQGCVLIKGDSVAYRQVSLRVQRFFSSRELWGVRGGGLVSLVYIQVLCFIFFLNGLYFLCDQFLFLRGKQLYTNVDFKYFKGCEFSCFFQGVCFLKRSLRRQRVRYRRRI